MRKTVIASTEKEALEYKKQLEKLHPCSLEECKTLMHELARSKKVALLNDTIHKYFVGGSGKNKFEVQVLTVCGKKYVLMNMTNPLIAGGVIATKKGFQAYRRGTIKEIEKEIAKIENSKEESTFGTGYYKESKRVRLISYEDYIRFKLNPYFRKALKEEIEGDGKKCDVFYLAERKEYYVFYDLLHRKYFTAKEMGIKKYKEEQ